MRSDIKRLAEMMLDPTGKGLAPESPWDSHLEFWSETIMSGMHIISDEIIGEFMVIANDVLKEGQSENY